MRSFLSILAVACSVGFAYLAGLSRCRSNGRVNPGSLLHREERRAGLRVPHWKVLIMKGDAEAEKLALSLGLSPLYVVVCDHCENKYTGESPNCPYCKYVNRFA